MPKITMTRDWKSRTAGETWNASEKVAEQLISGGFAAAEETAQPLDEERATEPGSGSAVEPETVETSAESEPEASPESQPQSESPSPIPQRHARHRSWIRIH
jgi:hypothetical protein